MLAPRNPRGELLASRRFPSWGLSLSLSVAKRRKNGKVENIQGVREVSLQFDFENLLQRQLTRYLRQICSIGGALVLSRCLSHSIFQVSCRWVRILLKWRNSYSSREVTACITVYWNQIGSAGVSSSAKLQNRVWKRSMVTSIQFARGARNSWRQGQCSTKGGVNDQEHSEGNIDRVRNRVTSWCVSCN